jgi:YD repeat-containing protein
MPPGCRATEALNNTTSYTYDVMNRLTKITAPDNSTTQFATIKHGTRDAVYTRRDLGSGIRDWGLGIRAKRELPHPRPPATMPRSPGAPHRARLGAPPLDDLSGRFTCDHLSRSFVWMFQNRCHVLGAWGWGFGVWDGD